MVTRHFPVVLEWDEEDQVWVTYVPTLGHLSTFGETRQEALDNTREAILGYLEASEKEGLPIPADASQVELVDVDVATA